MSASSQTFPPVAVTVMTTDHRDALSTWCALQPTIAADGLASRLIKRFSMPKGSAWILACRFLNERRDNG